MTIRGLGPPLSTLGVGSRAWLYRVLCGNRCDLCGYLSRMEPKGRRAGLCVWCVARLVELGA